MSLRLEAKVRLKTVADVDQASGQQAHLVRDKRTRSVGVNRDRYSLHRKAKYSARSQSALQDDFFSRRLSRSTSSNSSSYTSYPPRTVAPVAVQTIRNSSPSNQNAQAGPSRSVPTAYESSSLLRSHDTLEMGSPAIRTSVSLDDHI